MRVVTRTCIAAAAVCAAVVVAVTDGAGSAETLVERGAYLVTTVAACGICQWTEAEIVGALRNGKRPDWTVIGPPMPIRFYRLLSDRDAAAIAAYLRSLKPISHEVGRTQFKNPLPPSWGPPVTHVDEPPQEGRIVYGGYLAGPVGHCA